MTKHTGDGRGPLRNVRVIAIEQSVAGPLASRVLADLGADVVKVEPPDGDFARHWDSHVHGHASHFVWLNRRKRGIAIDFREPGSRLILRRLLDTADVLIFNLSVGAAERLGLKPEELGKNHPELVVCQITGYGRNSSARDRRAYDMLLQAESGLMGLTGDAGGPARIGVSVSDIGTGLYAATLILAALLERQESRRGRFIDLSMFEVMTEFAGPNLTAFANNGVRYARRRASHHNIVPYGLMPCSDGSLVIAIEQDAEWQRFCTRVLRREDLATDADLRTNVQRVRRRAFVEREVARETASMTVDECRRRLDDASIAYGAINEIDAVWAHPVQGDLRLHRRVRLPDGQLADVPCSPAERAFGRNDTARIPEIDEHRRAILGDTASEIL